MALDLTSAAFYQYQVENKISQWDIDGNLSNVGKKINRDRIKTLINNLKSAEQATLDIIAPGITIEELRQNVRQAHDNGLLRLSHEDVELIISKYRYQKNKVLSENLDEITAYLQSDVFEDVLERNQYDIEKSILEIANTELESLRLAGQGGTGHKISSHSKLASLNKIVSLNQIVDRRTAERIFFLMGAKTRERVESAVAKYSSSLSAEQRDKWTSAVKKMTKATDSDLQVFIPDIFAYTQGKKGSDANDEEVMQALPLIKKEMVDYICAQKPAELSNHTVQQIVDYVFNKNPRALFVGNNTKAITGILGEIQALCYLAIIMGNRFNLNSGKVVDWVATETDSGKSYHADIVLKQAFGIQVKNTIKDDVDVVSFNESSLLYMTNQLAELGYLTKDETEIIRSIYSTYYFNIPYQVAEGKLEIASFPSAEYESTNTLLEKYVLIADKILRLLIDYFMYIGIGNAAENQRGNTLFFLGGKNVVLASEILSCFLEEIDRMSVFTIERPERLSNSLNIVTFVNGNNLLRNKKGDNYISGKSQRIGALVDAGVSSSILLTSSFDFTPLLNKIGNK